MVLFAALVVIALFTVSDYAISNDEEVQHHYGELIIAYYRSGFIDQTLFSYRNLYLYGGLFDVIAVAFSTLVPFEPYAVRHVLSALCGIGGIAATWATARLIAGPGAGLLAAILLTLTGPWYGAMFNHTKDIPFAAAMMGAIWLLLRATRALPHPRRRDVLGFGLLLGAALGLRALALLLIGYATIAIVMHLRDDTGATRRDRVGFVLRSGLALLPALVIGYLVMIAAWPWAALAPLNPLRAIFSFAHFHYEIRTPLAGQVYLMSDVPRWYVSTYLLIKLPLTILGGALLAILVTAAPGTPGGLSRERRREIALVSFTIIFPLACQAIGRGPAFTGLRHFLFVVPPLAVLAGIGFDAVLQRLRPWRGARFAAAAALFTLLASQAVMLVRLHPHQTLFYNPLVGGLSGAARHYVMDYWVNILPEAVSDLNAFVARLDDTTPGTGQRRYTVAVCGERLPFEKLKHPRLLWADNWDQADFFIAPTHMNCDGALNGAVVTKIERLGALVGVVKDRRDLIPQDLARGY